MSDKRLFYFSHILLISLCSIIHFNDKSTNMHIYIYIYIYILCPKYDNIKTLTCSRILEHIFLIPSSWYTGPFLFKCGNWRISWCCSKLFENYNLLLFNFKDVNYIAKPFEMSLSTNKKRLRRASIVKGKKILNIYRFLWFVSPCIIIQFK